MVNRCGGVITVGHGAKLIQDSHLDFRGQGDLFRIRRQPLLRRSGQAGGHALPQESHTRGAILTDTLPGAGGVRRPVSSARAARI